MVNLDKNLSEINSEYIKYINELLKHYSTKAIQIYTCVI